MKRRAYTLCLTLLLLSILTFQDLPIVESATEEEREYYIKSSVAYSNKGTNVWNFTDREKDYTVGLFMDNHWQTVSLVNSTPLVKTIRNDTDGNRVAVLQFPKMLLNPGESINYTVTYNVVSKARTLSDINVTAAQSLEEIPPTLKDKYSKGEGPWLVNNTNLQNLAHNITENETNVLMIVRDFVDWISNNITYSPQQVPQYPNETLVEQEGDCDDQAILLITLCRIVGIPAFLQIGAIYTYQLSNTSYWNRHLEVTQKRIGWHGWAMVYIPPWKWLPVDLTYVFGGLDNPLNAITNAAVTSQITIQYMNISQTDYVASSRNEREFLTTNNFYVHIEDEMIEEMRQKDWFGESAEWWFPAVLVVAAVLLVASSYAVARKLRREKTPPVPPTNR
ncbi:MAG: transglutaminase-like domain-containing protein [Candidatus Bathyarchaeota archaeon]|jgi:hypothetical protein|nr:transglutaminase-like domain-containing protein [Candidatus Bathyarchaeota archaeon]